MQKLRTLSRVFLVLFMTVHLVTWYILGIHLIGSIGIEGLFSGLSRGVINAGFIFWMLVFVSALLLGRAFCGWFCWFGGYLELVEWIIGKLKIKIPRRMLLYLGVMPFVALALKIYSTLLVKWLQGFPATFTFRLADVEPWGGQCKRLGADLDDRVRDCDIPQVFKSYKPHTTHHNGISCQG